MKLRWFNKGKEELKQRIEIEKEKIIPDPISLQMLMVMEQAIKSIQQVPEEMQYPVKDYDTVTPPEIQRLIDLGFKNVEKVRKYEEELNSKKIAYIRKCSKVKSFNEKRKEIIAENEKLFEKFKFLLKVRQIYGKNTLLLPYSAFFSIIERNNLACGLFEDYLGEIPEDKLQEIQDLISAQPIEELKTLYKITYFSFIPEDSRWERSFRIFPFHFGKKDIMHRVYKRGVGVIQEPFGDLYSYKILVNGNHIGTYDQMYGSHLSSHSVGVKFFITAPKNLIRNKSVIKKVPNPDPFICALTEYGIIVTVRWGEEANDGVIQRFETFSKNLEKFGL